MDSKTLNYFARAISQRLLVIQCGPMDAPGTWEDVATRRGHEWEYFYDAGAGPGEWVSCEAGTGVIRINAAYPPHTQAKAFVHELAHAEMCCLSSGLWQGNVPGFLRGAWACEGPRRAGYDDEPSDIRHKIAQAVEAICFRRV